MKCSKCLSDFPENEIEESHNIPCYLFDGITKKERKQNADSFGRKWLCKECHDEYEAKILQILFRNLLHKEIPLILDRLERAPYFPKIWRLTAMKKIIGIKICLKLNGVENGRIE